MKFNRTYALGALVPVGLIAMILVGAFNSVREERISRQDPERLAYHALIRDQDRLQSTHLPEHVTHALSPLSNGGVMHYRGDKMAVKDYAIVCLNAFKIDEGVPMFVRLSKGQISTIRNDVVTAIMAREKPCRGLGPKF